MPIGYETTIAVASTFALLVASIYFGRHELAGALKKGINRYSLIALALIVSFFLVFSLLFVKPAEQLYFDENIYQGIAMNILKHGNALWCQFGTGYVNKCYANALYHDPVGWTFFIAIAFALFGIGINTAFNLELLVGALSVVAAFLLSSVIFENKELATLATFAFALSPELFIWSRSQADIDLPFMMLATFAFFFFVVFTKERNRKTLAMFLFSMVLVAYMRVESVLLIPLFILLFFLFSDKGARESAKTAIADIKKAATQDTKTLMLLLLAVILLFPQLHYIAIETQITMQPGSTNYGQAPGQKVLSLGNFKKYLPINAEYVFGLLNSKLAYPAVFLFLATPLALLGSAMLAFDKSRANRFGILALLGLWPLMYFVFYTSFYAGYATYGVDVRFMLQILPGVCLLAAYAVYQLAVMLTKLIGRTSAKYLTIALLAAILLVYPFVRVAGIVTLPPSQMPQQQQIYPVMQDFYSLYNKVPANCLVFSSTPDIWYEVGRASAQEGYIFNANQTIAKELSKFNCFVFDYGYWCTVPPQHSGFCQAVLNSFATKVLATAPTENGYNITYYLLLNYTPS